MRKPPCKKLVDGVWVDCEKRCLGCHSWCKAYSEYDEANIEERKERLRKLDLDASDTARIVNADKNRRSAYQRHMKKRDENNFALRMKQEENGGM